MLKFKVCSGQSGVIYNFNVQSLVAFEDNKKYKGDLLLTACIDFETTALTDSCLNPEDRNMFPVSYVIILAFHPHLEYGHIITEKCYGQSLEKLTSLNYLTRKELTFRKIQPFEIKRLSIPSWRT